jgi:integrase
MSRPRSLKPPTYRHHKARGLAVVTIDGKDEYLGKYGSPESHEKYARLIAEWRQRKGQPKPSAGPSTGPTIADLTLAYLPHCESYYPSRIGGIRSALRTLNQLYAGTLATNFGPVKLQSVREAMIDRDLCRRYVNDSIITIRRLFKWAASQEMVPIAVYDELRSIEGLRKGKTRARESEPVKPVAEGTVRETIGHAPPAIAAMIELQYLTGARPGEVCQIRPADVTFATNGVWCYRPQQHKTQHHGKDRRIYIGAEGQDILRPFLKRDSDAYCFSPRESEDVRNAERKAERKSPMTPSQKKRKRKTNRKRQPKESYTKDSYCRAVKRAAEKAGVPTWTPNQLRHTRATIIRERFGIEAAQVVLGHSDPRVTEIYAEKNFQMAEGIMSEIG